MFWPTQKVMSVSQEDAPVPCLMYRKPTDTHQNLATPPSGKLNSFILAWALKRSYFVGLCPVNGLEHHSYRTCTHLRFFLSLPKLRTVTNTYGKNKHWLSIKERDVIINLCSTGGFPNVTCLPIKKNLNHIQLPTASISSSHWQETGPSWPDINHNTICLQVLH